MFINVLLRFWHPWIFYKTLFFFLELLDVKPNEGLAVAGLILCCPIACNWVHSEPFAQPEFGALPCIDHLFFFQMQRKTLRLLSYWVELKLVKINIIHNTSRLTDYLTECVIRNAVFFFSGAKQNSTQTEQFSPCTHVDSSLCTQLCLFQFEVIFILYNPSL